MEQILQSASGPELISFLDGFSSYNPILFHPEDRLKTTFRTKWGTYAYPKIPFGLINAGLTFQRAIDIAFRGLINTILVVYLDYITICSKKISDHYHDCKKILQCCLKYGISLNPKKSYSALREGKMLGFIVSKEGICIDTKRKNKFLKFLYPITRNPCSHF